MKIYHYDYFESTYDSKGIKKDILKQMFCVDIPVQTVLTIFLVVDESLGVWGYAATATILIVIKRDEENGFGTRL